LATVIVPAFNSASTIAATLQALADQDLEEPYEVIVVDDGSQDETVLLAEAAPGPVSVLRQLNRGPGPARNLGAEGASGQVLAFTDADCVPTRGWLREGILGLRHADLVQGAVRPAPSVRRKPFDHTISVTGQTGLFETASLFVSGDLFRRLGGFEDWLQPGIGKPLAEDVWFGWRALRAGARVEFSPAALVDHAVVRRSMSEYVLERRRLTYFADIAKKVPELREAAFYRHWFLSRRTAAFDAALIGAVGAGALMSPLPLLGAGPYAFILSREALAWRRHAPRAVVGSILADAVGFAALLFGSVRRRTLLV
jgi:glycosyltransferase involved in cell wall biosynthesis